MEAKKLKESERAEISMMYRQAADKLSQIKILSELYLISKKEVCDILLDAGISDGVIERIMTKHLGAAKAPKARAWTLEEEEKAKKLYLEGVSYQEIGEKLGRSSASVRIRLTGCMW